MTAHYKEPILLIEFDEKKSFNLEVRLSLCLPVLHSCPDAGLKSPEDLYRGQTVDFFDRL